MSAQSVVLQESTPLRDSVIWDLQDQFYIRKGPSCWTDAIVPHFVTSNSYIAYQYANCILGYIRDYYNSPNANNEEPIYIVEVGAGHGKLGFLILNHLADLKEFMPEGVKRPFVYVITDFTSNIVEFCQKHKRMQEHITEGVVDFAVFNCEKDSEMTLLISGKKLSEETIKTPVIAISNYLFNGLREDALSIANGKVSEAYISISTDREEPDKLDPEIISRMKVDWSYKPIEELDKHYSEEYLLPIIRHYADNNTNLNVLLPVGALRFVRSLQKMSHNNFLLLSADKAHSHEEDMKLSKENPHMAIHGSFSFMTNFHAMHLYFVNNKGESYHTPYYSGLQVAAFVMGETPISEFQFAWENVLLAFDPDSFSQLQRCIRDETPSPSLKNILALVRLSHYESEVFYKFKQVLVDHIPYASDKMQSDFKNDILHIANNFYPLSTSKDVDFDLGRLSMGLRDYETSIALFKKSMDLCGEHYVTWHNLGICYYYIDNMTESMNSFDKCLKIQPEYQDAKSWRARVEEKIHTN
ncbi:hypothetical protein JH06_0410 [Blastocystis sp. subtype 4]|uniref:hypothetical protein n=1 Tax=Blastocystis sp. subtype 4 TaxID=944170 RepID=UPI00071186DF|nr:hypothetical protein JH06_0410 [Blastocystis sp. subtype 4]KNB45984.1 hypothetical protein JH06_0410 [Blastocystis sp. subtype 4]|eukprot:XP_014529427.1 hypothetical protein JH06_0410 [Blastocystis sp. subtype 4]